MSPRRLLDQPELPAEQRALLQAGRARAPVQYDVARGALRLQRTLAEAAVASSSAASSAALPGGLALKLGAKGWLAIALAGVCAAGGSVAWLRATDSEPRLARPAVPRSKAPAVPPAAASPAPATDRTASTSAHGETAEQTVPAAADRAQRKHARARRARSDSAVAFEPPVGMSAERATASRTVLEAGPAPRRAAGPAPEPARVLPFAPVARSVASDAEAARPTASAEAWHEARAIARARRVLERDPARALRILARVARAHPDGYLVEEREALRVLALAAAGRTVEARRAGSAFLARHRGGPFTAQIKHALARDASR